MTYEIDKNNNGDCSDVATTLALGDVKQTLTNYFKVDVEVISKQMQRKLNETWFDLEKVN